MSIGRLIPTHKTKVGWDAWKKIAPSFRNSKWVIRESIFNGHDIAIVVNLDLVEKVYNENKESFGSLMTLEELKSCLREENSLFRELMNNHLCLGLLLGYGKSNSEIFAKNQKLSEGERTQLESFSTGHPILYYFSAVMPVYFACDPNSEETKELKKQYAKDREAIVKMAKNAPLFNRMLVLLNKKS